MKKYKTVIEVITEAEDKKEASYIAGEYLSGNYLSGVKMRCRTSPAHDSRATVAVFVIVAFVLTGLLMTQSSIKTSHSMIPGIAATDAVQPPLRTAALTVQEIKFKDEWRAKQDKEALNKIKNIQK